jgi:hypothetical protein
MEASETTYRRLIRDRYHKRHCAIAVPDMTFDVQ